MITTQKPPVTFGAGYAYTPTNNEGKHRTSLNAYKHGLTGQIHLFSAADQESFDKHCAGIVEALAPVGAFEIDLAEAIAQNRWRLKRVAAIESGIFAAVHDGQLDARQATPFRTDPAHVPVDDAKSQALTWLDKANNIQLLAVYEQRINRTVERNMAQLQALQAQRSAARDQALEEALLFAQLAKSKGETYNPAADFPDQGLVFSAGEFERLILRKQRLDEARDYAKSRLNPKSARQMPAAA